MWSYSIQTTICPRLFPHIGIVFSSLMWCLCVALETVSCSTFWLPNRIVIDFCVTSTFLWVLVSSFLWHVTLWLQKWFFKSVEVAWCTRIHLLITCARESCSSSHSLKKLILKKPMKARDTSFLQGREPKHWWQQVSGGHLWCSSERPWSLYIASLSSYTFWKLLPFMSP